MLQTGCVFFFVLYLQHVAENSSAPQLGDISTMNMNEL